MQAWLKDRWGAFLAILVFGAVGVGLVALHRVTSPLIEPGRALCARHIEKLRGGHYEEAWDEDTNAHYKAKFERSETLMAWRERQKLHGSLTKFSENLVTGGFDLQRGAWVELVYDLSFEAPRYVPQVHFFVRADGEGRVAIDESAERAGAFYRTAPW